MGFVFMETKLNTSIVQKNTDSNPSSEMVAYDVRKKEGWKNGVTTQRTGLHYSKNR